MWPGVSVVICCHNSERRLPNTLAHLVAQRVHPDIKWEVIIVDNSSTDDTSPIAESSWPRNAPTLLRIIREPRLGLSYARYKGIEEAKFEIVSFVDDDNWLCPEWVQTVSEIMRDNPDVGACGGRNEASCEEDPPWWFGDYAKDYAVGAQAEITGDVTFTRGYLWGAGLSIRKSAWRHLQCIGFRSLLTDRQGRALNSGGDSEICFALRLAGWRLWYDERLNLRHCIPPNRLKWRYLRRLYRGFGAATVGLEPYSEYMLRPGLGLVRRFRQTWQWKAAGTLKVLLKQLRNVRPANGLGEGSHQILKLEWNWGRFVELLKKRSGYNEGVFAVREMSDRALQSAGARVESSQRGTIVPRTTPVGCCPLCGARVSDKLFTTPDRLHKTPGEFTYRRCRSCRTVFQDPRVIAEDIGLCYPKQYYTHIRQTDAMMRDHPTDNSAALQSESRGLRRIRDKLREAIKSEVQSRPEPGAWGRVGKVLALSPHLRTRAFSDLVADELLPRTPRYPKALDVGCGTGDRMVALKKVGWQIEGVDVDPVAVDLARQVSGQPVWLGDFRELELPQREYGLVFLHHSFEHFDDPRGLLIRVKNLLAPKGRAVIVYPNPGALGAKIFGSAWFPWEVPRHLVLPEPRTLLSTAEEIGFRVIHLKYSSYYAAEYFAHSRAYRSGIEVNELCPAVSVWDRTLSMIEKLLLLLKFGIGEEVRVTLQQR